MLLQRLKRTKDDFNQLDQQVTPTQSKFLVYAFLGSLVVVGCKTLRNLVTIRFVYRRANIQDLDYNKVGERMEQHQRAARDDANKIWLEMIEKGQMFQFKDD